MSKPKKVAGGWEFKRRTYRGRLAREKAYAAWLEDAAKPKKKAQPKAKAKTKAK